MRVLQDIDESYPDDLPVSEVALYIAGKKADAYRTTLADDELVITADTVVIVDDELTRTYRLLNISWKPDAAIRYASIHFTWGILF